MTKPHIFLKGGKWLCDGTQCIGVGNSPSEAYYSWKGWKYITSRKGTQCLAS